MTAYKNQLKTSLYLCSHSSDVIFMAKWLPAERSVISITVSTKPVEMLFVFPNDEPLSQINHEGFNDLMSLMEIVALTGLCKLTAVLLPTSCGAESHLS